MNLWYIAIFLVTMFILGILIAKLDQKTVGKRKKK
jgi:hypothetical protein